MTNSIFINMPVNDLKKSIEFFTKLGYTFNDNFTGDTTACMIISDTIYVMLMAEEKFQSFTSKTICDASTSTEGWLSLSLGSRKEVDDIAEKALSAGGSIIHDPEDEGFMYSIPVQDLDGHVWNYFHMDMAAFEKLQDEQCTGTAK
jgi:uncharacterized protein